MFIMYDIGPSCLPRSDVTLLKNNEGENVSNKRHYCQLLKLFCKGKNIIEFFNVLFNICNICFNSRPLYTIPIKYTCRF